MTRHAREAVSLGIATAIGETVLLALMADWSNVGARALLFAFLIGPALFVALLAWRRREHAARSRVLFATAGVVALIGFTILGADLYRVNTDPVFRRAPNSHATSVPLAQWAVVGLVWVWLVISEAREKRAAR
jgi:hypothetical protein